MIAKKIDAMHSRFGFADGICGDCPHFLRYRYHDRCLLKCMAYGLTHSEATDWRVKWQACGMKDKEMDENYTPVFELVKGKRECAVPEQCEGQVKMELQIQHDEGMR